MRVDELDGIFTVSDWDSGSDSGRKVHGLVVEYRLLSIYLSSSLLFISLMTNTSCDV